MTLRQQSPPPQPPTTTTKKKVETKHVVTRQKKWFLILFLVLSILSTIVYNIGTSPQMKQWLRYTRNENDDISLRTKKHARRKYRTTQEIVASMVATKNSFQRSSTSSSTSSWTTTTTTTIPWWTKASTPTTTRTNSTLSLSTTTTTTKGSKKQSLALDQLNVGKVGQAVARAKRLGFINRIKGFSNSRIWNIIGTDVCLDQGVPDEYIINNRNHLPHAILLGVQKGGTTALYSYLDRHPNIIHSKKELYFLDETLDRLLLRRQSLGQPAGIPRRDSRSAYSIVMKKAMIVPSENQQQEELKKEEDQPTPNKKKKNGPVRPVRNAMNTSSDYDSINNKNNNGMIRLDLTPHYIYLSDRVPQRILCIVPWVKLFALLRNPVDRAFSNYNMKFAIYTSQQNRQRRSPAPKRQLKRQRPPLPAAVELRDGAAAVGRARLGGVAPTFDEYVRMDIAALYETGVLQDWNKVDFQSFSGSEQEFRAWQVYINSGLNAPVGMGLYAIMLKHLFQQFERHGKSISDDFLAIPSEQLKQDTDATYGRVLDFLGVPRISLDTYPSQNTATSKLKPSILPQKMSAETEQLLKDVFEPYNRELASLLGSEWENIWST